MSSRRAELFKNRIVIHFPFDLQLIEIVRDLPDRDWTKAVKGKWSLPASAFHCAQVIETLAPHGFTFDQEIEKCADGKAKKPTFRKKLPEGLYPYQREAVEFAYAARGRMILGDAPGVGKSAPAIVFAHLFGGERVLIVAPANVTWKWALKEVKMWAGDRTWQVIETGKQPIEDVDITIMSYSIMVNRYEELKLLPFDTMIFDEAHYLKSNKSQRNRVARKLTKGVPYLLFLTGTAFKNKRMEMFPLLNMIDPNAWKNAIEFGRRYCGGVFAGGHWIKPPTGETNTEELRERLSHVLLRRTKKQVIADLPDLTRVSVPVHIENEKEYNVALEGVRGRGRKGDYNPAQALTLMNELRQVVGRGKVGPALELAADLLESGEQVVLHAHHKEVVQQLQQGLLVMGQFTRVIDGSTKPKDRQDISSAFLDGTFRSLVISSAGKEGIDLYSSSHIVFVERQWTPADEEQLEARLHRNGQKNAVTAHYIVAQGTIDERLDEIVRTKRAEFAKVIDTDVIKELYLEVVNE